MAEQQKSKKRSLFDVKKEAALKKELAEKGESVDEEAVDWIREVFCGDDEDDVQEVEAVSYTHLTLPTTSRV